MKDKVKTLFNKSEMNVPRLIDEYKSRRLARYDIADGFRRIYLYHIQKTAGTSLNHMILSLGGENPADVYARLGGKGRDVRRTVSGKYIYVGWDVSLIQGGHYFYAFSHTPMHALKLPPRTFTITCLRDPRKRVISLYKEFLEYKVNNVDHACRSYSDAWIGNSFGDFLLNAPKTELVQQLYMFSERLDLNEAFDNIMSCSFVFRTENFEQGCKDLSRRLKLYLSPVHMRKTIIDVDFSDSDMAALDTVLEPEYRLLEKLSSYEM